MPTTTIQLAHGGGGVLSRELIRDEIVSRFGENGPLKGLPDAASLGCVEGELVFTTDSYVVQPLEFPGGSIGDLAVHGTVNDLAVSGARAKWLSLGLILEEGLELAVLRRVLDTCKRAADACGVQVVTGDTKVVRRGQCDGLYANTSGIGERLPGFALGLEHVQTGDRVLASGPLGDHGMAVLAAREGIDIKNGPTSDTGSVLGLVEAALEWAPQIRFMRDPTRGGAAAVLNEIVEERDFGIVLREADLPFSIASKAAAEMLGLDLMGVACEGRVLLVCAGQMADAILTAWRALPEGKGACEIGSVTTDAGRVILETIIGGRRLVDVPRGELLPRIC